MTEGSTGGTITEYMERPGGGRARSFTVLGVTVLVTPGDASDDDFARKLTRQLEGGARSLLDDLEAAAQRITELERQLAAAQLECAKLNRKIPPATPVKVFGGGCVRFSPPILVSGEMVNGTLWMLGNREKGWSSWGLMFDSWDDLFRRYNVKITEHGTDEHGQWWAVEPL